MIKNIDRFLETAENCDELSLMHSDQCLAIVTPVRKKVLEKNGWQDFFPNGISQLTPSYSNGDLSRGASENQEEEIFMKRETVQSPVLRDFLADTVYDVDFLDSASMDLELDSIQDNFASYPLIPDELLKEPPHFDFDVGEVVNDGVGRASMSDKERNLDSDKIDIDNINIIENHDTKISIPEEAPKEQPFKESPEPVLNPSSDKLLVETVTSCQQDDKASTSQQAEKSKDENSPSWWKKILEKSKIIVPSDNGPLTTFKCILCQNLYLTHTGIKQHIMANHNKKEVQMKPRQRNTRNIKNQNTKKFKWNMVSRF